MCYFVRALFVSWPTIMIKNSIYVRLAVLSIKAVNGKVNKTIPAYYASGLEVHGIHI
jgi:hypothetical protein